MFVYKDKTPYCIYTSKQTFEKHVHLLHLSNFKNSHYVLIKDFESFMAKKTNHHDKKHKTKKYCLKHKRIIMWHEKII